MERLTSASAAPSELRPGDLLVYLNGHNLRLRAAVNGEPRSADHRVWSILEQTDAGPPLDDALVEEGLPPEEAGEYDHHGQHVKIRGM